MRSDQAGMLLSGDLDLHSARDGLCHLALEGQYVAQLAVVLIGPDVLVGCAPNQLGVHTNPVALPYHRTFDEGVHPKHFGDLWQRELRALQAHNRGTGNDAQITDPGQPPAQLFGHLVSQVFLGGVARQVVQGQDGQGRDFGLDRMPSAAPEHNEGNGNKREHTHPA